MGVGEEGRKNMCGKIYAYLIELIEFYRRRIASCNNSSGLLYSSSVQPNVVNMNKLE